MKRGTATVTQRRVAGRDSQRSYRRTSPQLGRRGRKARWTRAKKSYRAKNCSRARLQRTSRARAAHRAGQRVLRSAACGPPALPAGSAARGRCSGRGHQFRRQHAPSERRRAARSCRRRARATGGRRRAPWITSPFSSEPDVVALLTALRPDVHAKGTDYTVDTVPERETARQLGRAHRHRRRPQGSFHGAACSPGCAACLMNESQCRRFLVVRLGVAGRYRAHAAGGSGAAAKVFRRRESTG